MSRKPQKPDSGKTVFWKQEQGSALVMVMFVVLLLTVLGVAVLSATLGGAQRTELRENDVQSLHLAQKALDESIAYISQELDRHQDIDPLQLDNILTGITSTLETQKSPVYTELNQNGSAEARLTGIQYSNNAVNGLAGYPTLYHITLTAEARVNGVTRTLQQVVTIDTFPEFLSYALGSERNLTLNGAPSITGNIYSGQLLRLSRNAEYRYNSSSDLKQETLYPALSRDGQAYVQSMDSISREGIPVNADMKSTADNLEESLGIPLENIVIKNNKKFVQINLEETMIDKVTEALNHTSRNEVQQWYQAQNKSVSSLIAQIAEQAKKDAAADDGGQSPLIHVATKPVPPANPTSNATEAELQEFENRSQLYEKQMNELDSTFKNMQDSMLFEGDLELNGITFSQINYPDKNPKDQSGGSDFKKWLIVHGNLIINNPSDTPVQIKANIIVTGKMIVQGKADMDATIYVMSPASTTPASNTSTDLTGQSAAPVVYTTILQDAVIRDLDSRELVLMSKGGILLNRFDAFNNKAVGNNEKIIRGFFYTESSAWLYGVGSIFSLEGGFFARGDLTVNAVAGTASAGGSSIQFNLSSDHRDSRFQVKYDEKIFTAQQPSGLPRVKQVNIKVGKLELVKNVSSNQEKVSGP
ncbi:hypothetical protein [Paenibacillus dauci]|uniref:hypothetical protein n=1 Tax=Paenibacillus dauci TaxID=1567106 RepID=UPI000619F7FB|nr:hypothetical protein [Paenibacillus dauci]